MSEWDYRIEDATPGDLGYPYFVRDNGVIVENWNNSRRTWAYCPDAVGVFIGFEGGFSKISEAEVNRIISEYLAKEKAAR